jgi:hypothetical protein
MKYAGFKQVSSFSLFGAIAVFGLIWAVSFTPAPAAAQGTPQQQQACTPDAMRLCGEFVPDVARITACMNKKRAQLSPACREATTVPSHGKTKKSRKHHH